MSRKILLLAAALAAFASCPFAQAAVVVIDPQGQPGAPLLQAAILAAADGDIVLLKIGDYSQSVPLAISGKGLTIINDSGAPLVVERLVVDQVPAGSVVVVRGLRTTGWMNPGPEPGIAVTACAGAVWIEDCFVFGGASIIDGSGSPTLGGPAVSIAGSASVILERCGIEGGRGGFNGASSSSGGAGIDITASAVVLHDCSSLGGSSGDGPIGGPGVIGGPGLLLHSGTLFAAGSGFHGGNLDISVLTFGHSGNGLHVLAGTCRARDCSFSDGFSLIPGYDGMPIVAPPGAVSFFPAAARSLVVSSPVRSGQTANVTIDGQPGDVCALFLGVAGTPLLVPPAQGSFLLTSGVPLGPYLIGTVPGGGTLSLAFAAPPLPPAIPDGVMIGVQAAIFVPGGTLEAGSAYVQVRPGL